MKNPIFGNLVILSNCYQMKLDYKRNWEGLRRVNTKSAGSLVYPGIESI